MTARFTHTDTGRSEQSWAASPLTGLPAAELTDRDGVAMRRLVVLAAHPDDETLGAGGLIARAAALGAEVTVVVATQGEASHPDSPTHTPERLAQLRRDEIRAAVAHLHASADVVLLGLPDGRLAAHEPTVTADLHARLTEPGTVLAAPWHLDGHTDHDAAGRAAAAAVIGTAVRLLEYPVWAWLWAQDADIPWDGVVRLELEPDEREAKAAALGEHTSQVGPLSDAPGDEAILLPDMVARFERPFETFLDAERFAGIFERIHAGGADPWGFRDRWYERRKRALTVASLPRERFRRGLEVGCSIGVLTAELAPRCDRLVATDVSPAALAGAASTLADAGIAVGEGGTVDLQRLRLPEQWPEGAFDLVVVSEVGYYLTAAGLDLLADRILASLTDDGVVLLCHWRHPMTGWALDGDPVHERLRHRLGLHVAVRHVEEDVLIEVLARPGVGSVARETGLL
ncbi:bifunctional PIG-L family deacetylase/class I SAM-dependent methyltransferase [Tersicoccus sp. MR15.9]|uniref:bifunctional PIG-L family deacetylase/class I SAM-dependent methyltransferase n=1 Tax=Tersicoccus mangrovi TaxID=3121635 RepID=UPI002FE64F72